MGRNGKVTIALPNVEGAQGGHTESVYQGPMKPHQKECVLIIDHETGQITLERLAQSMIVKKTRANSNSSIANATKLPPSSLSTTNTNYIHSEDLNGERAGPSKLSQPTNNLSSAKYTSSNNNKPNGTKPPPTLGLNGKKVSPPLAAARQVANGKSTPSPPSMPIFNRGTLVQNESVVPITKGPTRMQSTTSPIKTLGAAVNGGQKDKDLFDGSSSSSISSSSSDDELSDVDAQFEKVLKTKKKMKFDRKTKASPSSSTASVALTTTITPSNSLSMPSFSALAAAPARVAGTSSAAVVADNSNGHSTKPPIGSQNKKTTKILALSEDSDSDSNDDPDSEDEDFISKTGLSNNNIGGDFNKSKTLPATTNGNSIDHSMPKFTTDTTTSTSATLSMPKFSTLSMYSFIFLKTLLTFFLFSPRSSAERIFRR